MIDRKALLTDLKQQARKLERDLVEQVTAVTDVYTRLRDEYREAFEVERTAATWETWRDERVTQAAAAWVLGTVFVRFCEDNGLLEQPFLAGPTAERMTLAEEHQEQFFSDHPEETDREWLEAGFDAIQSAVQSGTKGVALFSKQHNPLYQIPMSHDAAKALTAFWRSRGEDGRLVHDFSDPEWDTRFLGDLYQDLSEAARKTYALLQTPEFVEEFILDLTLKPAIEEFGYDEVKLIDPTCGSGHFLLGAFHRLVEQWEEHSSITDAHERVRRALEAVHGVDINPFAVAIARFRLLVAALRAAGFRTLREAAGYTFPVKVAVGDSLIRQPEPKLYTDDRDRFAEFKYWTEDVLEYPGILDQDRYHVVVGNPPYVTVRDPSLNGGYRKLYKDVCRGHYALSVAFARRFFELARGSNQYGREAGYVGQITANSFMRREFGRDLIEVYFSNAVELTHVLDTSGAYIPGHGTPTVILVGHRNNIRQRSTIRAALGIQGEPSVPEHPATGRVWSSIVENIDAPGTETPYVSIIDVQRESLLKYPWSLSGGGAGDLRSLLDRSEGRLSSKTDAIGRTTHTGQDEAYYLPESGVRTHSLKPSCVPVVVGEGIRDYAASPSSHTFFPYDGQGSRRELESAEHLFLWPMRTMLRRRVDFGQHPEERGLRWFDHSMFFAKRYRSPLSIGFAFVATHNQFALDRGGNVFNRTAPAISLLQDSDEDEHLGLLGLLNSSTACFWLKQVCHDKGIRGEGGGITSDDWEHFYEFTGTKIDEFPLPGSYPLDLARQLDTLAQQLATVTPASVAATAIPTRDRLTASHSNWDSIRAKMIALQEELDWQVYALYGLLSEELTASPESVPELQLGERAFEIVLARNAPAGEATPEWFTRHGSTPTTKIPAHWPDEYKALVETRIAVIEHNRSLALIERPECKRRWATEGWDKMEKQALRGWLLDRCETRSLWYHEQDGAEQPRLLTAARLAHELRRDPDVVAVADLYAPGQDFTKVIEGLVADEHVPYLAALRYKDTGLSKRDQWEYVWAQQRNEDDADTEDLKAKIRAQIPVPPKYSSADFRKTSYWRHRGKLDVAKERFISYPDASRTGDPSLLLGWAGWDHREQAQALAGLIGERCDGDGWGADQLVPLLAGLREVLPWVWQWHGEFDSAYGMSPAQGYADFLAQYTERLNVTDTTLAGWRPLPGGNRRRRRPAAGSGPDVSL